MMFMRSDTLVHSILILLGGEFEKGPILWRRVQLKLL